VSCSGSSHACCRRRGASVAIRQAVDEHERIAIAESIADALPIVEEVLAQPAR